MARSGGANDPRDALIYQPHPRQIEFHRSPAKYRLFGGAAGPGKTTALLHEAVRLANRWPATSTLLLRRTFPELEESLLREFRRGLPRDLYRAYNDSKHVVTWHNGSTTRFGYSASEHDIYQYQGAEYLFIGVDELTHFTLGQWQFLTSRNRCPVPGARPCMAGASNPGNIGHAWVKALWMDKRAAAGMDPASYDPEDYEFIRATLDDNPVYRDDAQYRKTLEALPRHLRQAFLEGDWDVFAGQYFDVLDPERNTEPAATALARLKPWSPRWISIDWGFEHPAAVYWHGTDPNGVTVTYREFVQQHLSPRMLAEAIAERSETEERFAAIYLSPDAFARRTSEQTIAGQMEEVFARLGSGRKFPPPAPADTDRVGGWLLMYQLLESGGWIIARSCERLIECLPVLTRDPARVEDVLKSDGDDPADAARYGLKSRLAPGSKPIEQRVAEAPELAGVTDPTSRAIRIQQALARERRKDAPFRFGSRHRPQR